MRQRRALWLLVIISVLLLSAGCVSKPQKTEKLRDLEFTVIDKADVPKEFSQIIEENKNMPFRLTYADQGVLYIAEGYGAKEKTGYSVKVTELYETKNTVCFHTNLLGPEKGEKTKEVTTFPYVVVKVKYLKKDVVFD